MKKTKVLEILILLIIITSIITIFFFTKKILSSKIENSTSNEIKDYTKVKKYTHSLNIKELDDKYILQNLIDEENSSIEIHLSATDNLIDQYEETIILNYLIEDDDNDSIEKLHKYCDNYNDIKFEYQYKCTYYNNTYTIENKYKLNKIDTDKIKTPIPPNSRLNVYLKNLDDKGIKYEQE